MDLIWYQSKYDKGIYAEFENFLYSQVCEPKGKVGKGKIGKEKLIRAFWNE